MTERDDEPVRDDVRLVAGGEDSAWHRAVVSEALAKAADSVPVYAVLNVTPDDLRTEPAPGQVDRAWKAVDSWLASGAVKLADVRDEHGRLVEVRGPVAPSLVSKKFRQAALKLLGAQEALACSPDGLTLRLRDAWREDPPADAEALLSEGSLVEGTVWRVGVDGVRAVVHDGQAVDERGKTERLVVAGPVAPDRDQVVFARALLAFLGGILVAMGMAWAISSL